VYNLTIGFKNNNAKKTKNLNHLMILS